MEQKFVCDDAEVEEWSEIPLQQKVFHLRSFLESRGYHTPQFRPETTYLSVHVGPQIKLQKILVQAPRELDFFHKYTHFKNSPITPQLLDSIESWFREELSANGYPCTQVQSIAIIDEKMVEVQLRDLKLIPLGEIDYDLGSETLDRRALQRYVPLTKGDLFDHRLLELASRRMAEDGFLLSSHFTHQCQEEEVNVKQRVIYGEPRLIRLGLGVDSEEFLIGLASWKTTRLDALGSSFLIRARASFKEQEARFVYQWYLGKTYSLLPTLSVKRLAENRYSILKSEGGVAHDFVWNAWGGQFNPRLGVRFSDERRLAGRGPSDSQIIIWSTQLDWMSHLYEYYIADPRTGFHINSQINYANSQTLSPVDVLELNGLLQWNINIGNFRPPAVISSWKLQGRTTATDAVVEDVPFQFRHFLGGSQDLRGFARKELPEGEFGAKTAVSLGTEFRSSYVFSKAVQLFLLFDLGLLGGQAFRLNSELYYNPGLGVRYQSPIGVFRATAAHGFVAFKENTVSNVSHPQFYLKYGVEF